MSKLFACSGGQSEIKGAPEKVKILPIGHVKSQKGDFNVDEESFRLMKEKFIERGLDIVIDYEHQTLKDVQAPAGGWIKDLSVEDGAIVAKVEWTPQGKKYLENKEYRYLSPVVLVRKADDKAIVLHSVALTNTPAIDGMFPIINSIKVEDYEGGNSMEILKQLAALLGLGADATEEQVIEALKALVADAKNLKEQADNNKKSEGGNENTEEKVVANKVICEMLGLKAGAKTEDVAAAIVALSNKKSDDSVSEKEFKELKDKIARRDANDSVVMALKAGKLTPAQKDWATEYALKDPDGFKAFVEKAPQGVPMGELEIETKANKDEKLSDTEMRICKQLGVSDEDLKKYGKDVN